VKRLLATLVTDVRLQWRNGFYYAVGFLLACWAVALSQLPALPWRTWLPALVLGNLGIGTFLFLAGLVLLEKGEGTLEAQIVTPLSARAYLVSKVATLAGLALVEHVALVAIVVGGDFSPGALLLGVASGASVYCLTGFLAVSRYDSVDAFLMPSALWLTALSLPTLDFAGLWRTPLMALHPLQPALVLLRGAFGSLAPSEWGGALAGSALWIALLLELGRRRFVAFAMRAPGTGA